MKMDDLYECYPHKKNRVRYHIILVTKYRRKCLDSIRSHVFQAFSECSKHSDIKIHRMNIDQDHIHFIISFPTKYSIDQTIRRMKQFSTNHIYTHCNEYIRKFYLKSRRILWSDSYFCSTIGLISESIVDEYIKNHG